MPEAGVRDRFAVKSYRYLRLAIVLVLLSIFASVLIERLDVDCWQRSISAYYYTPVRAVFVSGLVAIGVSLIAIKGDPGGEDIFLNFAGVLAPIVAFVPTSLPEPSCSSVETVLLDPEAYVDNNLLAYAIGGALAIGLSFLVAWRERTPTFSAWDRPSLLGLAGAGALLVAGLVWYLGFRDHFLDQAHFAAAVAMFVALGAVMVVNVVRGRRRGSPWRWYAVTAAAMALSAVVVLAGKLVIDPGWRHQTLWLEFLELGAVLVYWAAQTGEHWSGGPVSGARRRSG